MVFVSVGPTDFSALHKKMSNDFSALHKKMSTEVKTEVPKTDITGKVKCTTVRGLRYIY